MNVIVAADRRWAIGKDGHVLVSIPADWQMLMRETAGKVVVMGRKTLESLPGAQPLGNRVNLILTHDEDYKVKGALVCHSLEQALDMLSAYETDDIFIIGGHSLYEQLLPYADTVHVTRIDYTYDADTFFLDLEQDGAWELEDEGDEQTYFDLCYTYQRFGRKR